MTNKLEPKPEVKLIEYFSEHWYRIDLSDGSKDYFPSVTTKLGIIDKPFLARWRGEVGNREADFRVKESQEKGSNIHNAWFVMSQGGAVVFQNKRKPEFSKEQVDKIYEDYAGNIAIITEQDEQVDCWKLQRWHELLNPEYVEHERTVYSLVNKEAGTCDKIIRIEEGSYDINGAKPLKLKPGLYVTDLKTGNYADDSAFMQISAYLEMFIEMGLYPREEFVGGIILHTGAKTRGGIPGLATLLRTKEELEQDYIDYRQASNLWLRKHKDAKPNVFEFPAVLTLKLKNQEEE